MDFSTVYRANSAIVLDPLVWKTSPGACDVEPPAANSGPWSRTVTSVQPRMTSSSASEQPTIPAPMITTRGALVMGVRTGYAAGGGFRGTASPILDREPLGWEPPRLEGTWMSTDPGVTGDPRTLADPLAESLRIVEAADARGLTVRLMGGMAIRAHAPDWTARTRRTEVDLDFATTSQATAPRSTSCSRSEGYTPDSQHNALFGAQAGVLRRRGPKAAGRRPRRQAGDVPPARVRRSTRRFAARRCRWPSCCSRSSRWCKINRKDVLDALVLLAEHPLGQDDGATDSAHGHGRDQPAADPGHHLERLGLVADRDRQPRQARPVPRDGLHAPRISTWAGARRPLRSGRAGRGAARRDRSGAQVDPLEAAGSGRRARAVVRRARGSRARTR